MGVLLPLNYSQTLVRGDLDDDGESTVLDSILIGCCFTLPENPLVSFTYLLCGAVGVEFTFSSSLVAAVLA